MFLNVEEFLLSPILIHTNSALPFLSLTNRVHTQPSQVSTLI